MAPSVLGIGNGVLFIPNEEGSSSTPTPTPLYSLYDNDTQTGPSVSTLDISFNSPSGGGSNSNNFGSLVVAPGGVINLEVLTCVNQTFSGSNPIMRYQGYVLRLYSDSSRTALAHEATINFGTAQQTVPCSTPVITSNSFTVTAGTYWIQRVINFNTSGSLGTPPFTYTFQLQ